MKQITEIQEGRIKNELISIIQELVGLNGELKKATSHLDLSENSERDSTKQKMSVLEARKTEIENDLQYSEVIKLSDGDRLTSGSLISVLRVGTVDERLFLFGGLGDTVISGYLSNTSPLGKAIDGNPSGTYKIQDELGNFIEYVVKRESISRINEFDEKFPIKETFFNKEFDIQ